MKEYILSIIAISIIGVIAEIISPKGEGGGISRHIKLIIALLIVLACLSPLTLLIDGLRELNISGSFEISEDWRQELESIFHEQFSFSEIEYIKENIEDRLYREFGIKKEDCSISIRVSADGNRLELIFLRLFGSAVWSDTNKIEDYLGSVFSCEIVVAIG